MIEAIDSRIGHPRASVTCDECGRNEVVPCDYEHRAGHNWTPKEGQIKRKLQGQGWAIIKAKLICPACDGKRKVEMAAKRTEADVTKASTVTELRQPTREQKRQIISLLDVAYDTDAERYKGTETDKTIAETIGSGVMPGWVSEIREELYGPDGGNGEMDALLAEMQAWVKAREREAHNARVHLEAAEKTLREVGEKIGEVAAFEKRLAAIRTAVGPKAARA